MVRPNETETRGGGVNAGKSVVIGAEEGVSYWQPNPARGYVTVKLTPDNMPLDTFSSGTQVLFPGASVRPHGHMRNHELVFVYKGQGTAVIDDIKYPIEPGVTLLFMRNSVHLIENTGEEEMRLFWIFMPPGLEEWFAAIGLKRDPKFPAPPPFSVPEGIEEARGRQRFI